MIKSRNPSSKNRTMDVMYVIVMSIFRKSFKCVQPNITITYKTKDHRVFPMRRSPPSIKRNAERVETDDCEQSKLTTNNTKQVTGGKLETPDLHPNIHPTNTHARDRPTNAIHSSIHSLDKQASDRHDRHATYIRTKNRSDLNCLKC